MIFVFQIQHCPAGCWWQRGAWGRWPSPYTRSSSQSCCSRHQWRAGRLYSPCTAEIHVVIFVFQIQHCGLPLHTACISPISRSSSVVIRARWLWLASGEVFLKVQILDLSPWNPSLSKMSSISFQSLKRLSQDMNTRMLDYPSLEKVWIITD